jgi:hypothetical protein
MGPVNLIDFEYVQPIYGEIDRAAIMYFAAAAGQASQGKTMGLIVVCCGPARCSVPSGFALTRWCQVSVAHPGVLGDSPRDE